MIIKNRLHHLLLSFIIGSFFLVFSVGSVEAARLRLSPSSGEVSSGSKIEVSQQDCVRAGCSGELCVETEVAGDLFTTCEFKSEYACFQNAICARLDSGECGFVEDEQFLDCLEQVRSNPADFLIAE